LHGSGTVRAFIGECGQEFRHRFAEDRVAEVGRNLAQRPEDESTAGQRGMRKGEPGRIHHTILQQQQIQVEGARAVGSAARAIAAITPLDGQQEIEESFGIEVGR
jgi:hypothetical protein